MKLYKISLLILGVLFVTASCDDVNKQEYAGGSITAAQAEATNQTMPTRVEATFNGMYVMMGKPHTCWPTGGNSGRADDFGFIMAALSEDLEGADMSMANNDYSWFSTACELSSRNANYANPLMRYTIPYRQIGIANELIKSIPETTTNATLKAERAQALAVRAFDYMSLAPYFQFSYATDSLSPCIPVLTDGADATNNPRATVKDVYESVMSDLNAAINGLAGYTRTSKDQIDQNVAYGLRARANLAMCHYAAAAADADKAMQGYTPASRNEVSTPSFYDLTDHNWMWGINITTDMVTTAPNEESQGVPTCSSWLSAFSGDGYAAGAQCYPMINKLLYDKIPSTDIRKQWWLDANMHSEAWKNLTWNGAKGDAIGPLIIKDIKTAMFPYVSIKFGMKSGIGSTVNNNDFPLMRVEEMILIKAEGLAKSGHEGDARSLLERFVQTYRDPSYSSTRGGRTLADEIWYQRRVELWGEGFFTSDAKRLGKPIVRFHDNVETSNFPEAFVFNMKQDDGWLNLRFPQGEKNNNLGIVDNTGGSQPVKGANPALRDGVTD